MPDYPQDSSKWEDWLTEIQYYWQNGYQVGGEKITGRYFFHLNFCTIEGLDERGYPTESYPYHVDVMKEIYDLIDESIKNRRNLFIWKARDKGFSYNMSSLALGEMMMERNNTVVNLFPKGEEVRYKENFRIKYDTSFNRLPQCMKRYPYLRNTQDHLGYGYKEIDEETGQETIKGCNNNIHFLKVSNKDVAKSFRTKLITIDEAGEIDCLKALHDTNEANLVRGGQKFGIEIIGGTSNAIHAGYKDVCFIWDNAEKLHFNKFFIPRYKALWGYVPIYNDKYDENGNIVKLGKEFETHLAINHETGESLEDIAEKYFMHREKEMEDMGDRNGLLEFKQNYPKNESDAFLRVTSSPFPIEELNAQKRIIETNEDLKRAITVGNIELVKGDGGELHTKFTPTSYGRWKMYLPPNPSLAIPDCIGVDTVRDEDVAEIVSKNAIVVYRPFQSMKELSGLPVCIYHNRPASIYDFFNDALLTCMHYQSMALIENINPMIFDYFLENNAGRYLAWRPTLLTELGSKAQNRWGVKAASGAAPALAYAIEETKTNVYNHPFVELIDELIKFGTTNTDLADAYKWAILQSKEMIKVKALDKKKSEEKKKPKFTRMLVNRGGKLIVVKNEKELLYGR